MKKIVLASTSPRRKNILAQTRLPFITEDSNYSENMTLDLSPSELAKYLSLGKAKAVAAKYPDTIIIAADTFVTFDGKVLGKPHTEETAKEMLTLLQGKTNIIITGVTVIDTTTGITESFTDEAKVSLRTLTDSEINNYIKSGEPLDKAGAYGIQGLGAVFVEKIEGDFFTVMGLPLYKLVKALNNFGIHVL